MNDHSVEVLLFYPKLGKSEKKGDFSNFFTRLNTLEKECREPIVFLDLKTALQYSRFMDSDHAILKAYVPHAAIEGRSHGLTLKKGIINKKQIHGCFPGHARGALYVENPHFTANESE